MGEGARRNERCPRCGQKLKNCTCKPVSAAVAVDFGEPVELDLNASGFDAAGNFRFVGKGGAEPVQAWRTTSYPRKKGEKRLTSMPVRVDQANVSLNHLASYRNVFGIDTNTIEVGSVKVSVSGIVVADARIDVDTLRVRMAPVGGFVFHGCAAQQENFAWSLLQSAIMSGRDYNSADRYAIVTDSDLSRHAVFNARTEPVFGETYLASNIDLLYASTDAGREPLNEIVRACDKLANEVTHKLGATGLANATFPVKDGPCARFGIFTYPVRNVPASWLRLGFGVPLEMAAISES